MIIRIGLFNFFGGFNADAMPIITGDIDAAIVFFFTDTLFSTIDQLIAMGFNAHYD